MAKQINLKPGSDPRRKKEYKVVVYGDVYPVEDTIEFGPDHAWKNGNETIITGSVFGLNDKWVYTGEIIDIEADDGIIVEAPGYSRGPTYNLEIVPRGNLRGADYSFSTTGQTGRTGSLEPNDVQVNDNVVSGSLWGKPDRWKVTGPIWSMGLPESNGTPDVDVWFWPEGEEKNAGRHKLNRVVRVFPTDNGRQGKKPYTIYSWFPSGTRAKLAGYKSLESHENVGFGKSDGFVYGAPDFYLCAGPPAILTDSGSVAIDATWDTY